MTRCRSLLILFVVGALGAAFRDGVACAQPSAMPPTVLTPGTPPTVVQPPLIPAVPTSPAIPVIVSDDAAQLADGPMLDGPMLLPTPAPTVTWPGTTLAPWTWQLMPEGMMYRSYLAGTREPRLAAAWLHDERLGWLWDATAGARVGMLRFGTTDTLWPEGWQLDVEGAAFPRLDADRNLVASDFRAGVPLTTRMGPWEGKLGYYHLSSHLADEFMLDTDDFARINYVRDALVLGIALRPNPDWRLYGEVGWAFHTDGGAEPWEFQFGAEYSAARATGFRGSPFLAVHGALRQEVDFGGNLTAQAGWQWRGQSGRLARLGMQYFNGKSEQRQFYRRFEEQIGIGLWYDF